MRNKTKQIRLILYGWQRSLSLGYFLSKFIVNKCHHDAKVSKGADYSGLAHGVAYVYIKGLQEMYGQRIVQFFYSNEVNDI